MAALDKAAAGSKPLKAEGVRSYRGGMGVRAEPARRVSRPLRFHPYVRPAHETPTRPACSPLYDIPIPAILPGSRFHMGASTILPGMHCLAQSDVGSCRSIS